MILSHPHPSVLALLGLACSNHKICAPEEMSEGEATLSDPTGIVQVDPADQTDEADEVERTAAEGAPTDLTPEREAMRLALSARDQSPPCAEIVTLASEMPTDDYTWLIDHVRHPPWVGMRAARCILENHSIDASEIIESWVVNPELKGLGYLVLDSLDSLPQQQASDLARLAILEGPDPEAARERVAKSDNPIISDIARDLMSPESTDP
jgi:hypothetical protein